METFSHETLEPWFVTGFVDAQGSFTFSRSSKQIALYFSVKSQRDILERFNDFFGVGRIYSTPSSKGHLFRVTRVRDLEQVEKHFERYPLIAKRSVFLIWQQMLALKKQFRRVERDQLEQLANELSRHLRT